MSRYDDRPLASNSELEGTFRSTSSKRSPNTLDTLVMTISSALRQPLTLAAVFPLFVGYYAQAVLAILPNTFIFKLLLLPFILWQAWNCAIGLDCAVLTAQFLGRESTDRLRCSNLGLAVRSFSSVMSSLWIASVETGV